MNSALQKHIQACITVHEGPVSSDLSDDQSLFLDPDDLRVF